MEVDFPPDLKVEHLTAQEKKKKKSFSEAAREPVHQAKEKQNKGKTFVNINGLVD